MLRQRTRLYGIHKLTRSFSSNLVPSPSECRTIYALSTPPGKGGIGIIRISGPNALDVYSRMVRVKPGRNMKGKGKEFVSEPWKMQRCSIVHPNNGQVLDEGMVVFFQERRSYTAEPIIELHTHSGRALLSSILSSLSLLPTLRPALPGEFTKRALVNGRLDLTQVEGTKDLIDAETEEQRKIAVRAVGGKIKEEMDNIRHEVIKCLALVEALIDFGEGEDIEEGVYDQALERVTILIRTIGDHLNDSRRGEIVRSGIKLAIFGPPNVGKSSLLNFLAQREAAIVTPVPGTTRDILSLSLDIGGLPIIISDTAGLRKTDDLVEKIGVQKAYQAVENADVRLCVLSLSELQSQSKADSTWEGLLPQELRSLVTTDSTYFLLNKSDLVDSPTVRCILTAHNIKSWTVSLSTGSGTQEFLIGLQDELKERYQLGSELLSPPLLTRPRHRSHFQEALQFLQAFVATPRNEPVLAAEELRYASQAIAKVTGSIDIENILDVVFKDFCIGK